jgi:hypothetical protein
MLLGYPQRKTAMNKRTKVATLTLASLAMLAMSIPASARDRYDHYGDERVYHEHDRGIHRGWYKHDRDRDRDERRFSRDHDDWRFNRDRDDQRFFRDREGGYQHSAADYNRGGARYLSSYSQSNTSSGVALVGNQLSTGYNNLEAAYNAAVASGDRNGAKHYLNAIRAQQKQIAAFNTTWGNAGISVPINNTLPGNYYTPLNYAGNPYSASVDPRFGAALSMVPMVQQMIHP